MLIKMPSFAQQYSFFNACTSIVSSIHTPYIRKEAIENVVFNTWIWGFCNDPFTLKRYVSFWKTNITNMATQDLFQIFLIQSYYLCLKSKNENLTILRNSIRRILEDLVLLYLNMEDLVLLIDLCVTINNFEDCKIYLELIEIFFMKGKTISYELIQKLYVLIPKCQVNDYIYLVKIMEKGCPGCIRAINYQSARIFFSSHSDVKEAPLNADSQCINFLINQDLYTTLPIPNTNFNPNSELWYFWPLILSLWQNSMIETTVNFISAPMIYSGDAFESNLQELLNYLDYFEYLGMFNVTQFRFVFFTKLVSLISTFSSNNEEKDREVRLNLAQIISKYIFQEYIYVIRDDNRNALFYDILHKEFDGSSKSILSEECMPEIEDRIKYFRYHKKCNNLTNTKFKFKEDFIQHIFDVDLNDMNGYKMRMYDKEVDNQQFDYFKSLCQSLFSFIGDKEIRDKASARILRYLSFFSTDFKSQEPNIKYDVSIFEDLYQSMMIPRYYSIKESLSKLRSLLTEDKPNDQFSSQEIQSRIEKQKHSSYLFLQ